MMSLKRRPIQIVEIDLDYCTRTYGTAPCTAALSSSAPRKCFNTFFTCQDTANFNKGTLTLRFSKNLTGLPRGTVIYPALQSVGTNPVWINLGGVDDRTGPLGKRARVDIELLDFPDNDDQTDRYAAQRKSGAAQFSGVGYDPEARGTFFGKLRRRHPYYVGRALRVLDGYEGEALASMRTRHYVISEWEGPDMSGRVKIVAKDVLDLADNEKALCPAPSTGKLGSNITTGLVSFDLTPETVGSEYATSGRASIGSEIVSFTRSGDTITLTGRGLDGTDAATHSTDDLFQQCYRVEGLALADVAEDLLVNYASVPSGFIPSSDWAEESQWIPGFNLTATISKPTGVTDLMGELGQLGVFFWWDDVAQEIRMRANRPQEPDEVLQEFSDASNVVEGSLRVADLHKQRITQVVFWHGLLDASGSATDGSNYRRAYVVANDGGSVNQHNQDRIHEVFCRWLGDGNDAIAGAVAERLANRFEETPRQVTFDIDAKDRAVISPADLMTLTTRALQDETGESLATELQITSMEEVQPGHRLTVVAQTYQFQGRFGFWLQNPQQDYDTAPEADKRFGAFWFDANEDDFGDGTGPYVYF
jgi:hypothetical protein